MLDLSPMTGAAPDRRQVLRLMAASMALGGLGGCDPAAPERSLFPAVIAPPGIVPGRPDFYSTATLSGGAALGVVVEHAMGRPIKVEGNPEHPTSRGATDALAQAAILDFYDPDRAGGVQRDAAPSDRPALLGALARLRDGFAASHGAGLRIVTGPVASPSLEAAIRAVLAALPAARWHVHDPAGRASVHEGAALAYGRPADVLVDLDQADVILALQSDLVDGAPGHVRHARTFAARRNPVRGPMSRVYAAEFTPTLIGTAADHRFVVEAARMQAVVAGLSAGLLGHAAVADAPEWLAAVVADLMAHRGRALIHAGPDLPAAAHAQVHALNEALGARGRAMRVIEADDRPADLAALLSDIEAGRVGSLVVLDTNPAVTAPGFAQRLSQVSFSLCSAPLRNETGQACRWFVPMTHPFESWGDARADDGSATVMQPQALPLFGGMSPLVLLPLLVSGTAPPSLEAVRTTWRAHLATDEAWRGALAAGVIPGTATAALDTALRPEAAAPLARPERAGVSVVVRPDPYLGDGRHANNAWLQELPRPLTKVVWDNPLLVGPALAARLNLVEGDEVELAQGDARVSLPVHVMPGQAGDVVVATLGYGRKTGGVAAGVGVDVAPLLGAGGAVTLRSTGQRMRIATTDHADPLAVPAHRVDEVVRHATLAAFVANPDFARDPPPAPSLYDKPPGGPVAWGMSIDLNACIGCNACVVACTAENNVPVVGRAAVLQGREMHWLRIDRYYQGTESMLQPVLCMHCEQAPCEVVCPVGATTHDEEGLNVMTYNRCVGTRFCSNNCPYKVRRFNFGAYAANEVRPPPARNPDVSVRARGVMEKCTFCVQRIAQARIEHDRDGVAEQAVTACQAACPTRAFTFGDLNDPASDVRARKASPLDYTLLPEQRTKPRVTYEARIRNPNPAIPA